MRKIIIFVFGILMFVQFAAAQTWQQLVDQTLKNNAQIQSANFSLQAARAALKSAQSKFLPTVSADSSYTRSGGNSAKNNDFYSYGVSLNQNIFNGFADAQDVKKARANLVASQADFAQVEADVFYSLRRAFVNALFAQENVKLFQKISKRRKENKDLIELRYQAGLEHSGTVSRAKAQSADAEFQLRKAQRDFKLALAELESLVQGKVESVEGQLKEQLNLPQNMDFKNLLLQVPNYQKQNAVYLSLKAQSQRAQSEFLPTLSFLGSTEKTGNTFFSGNNSWNVGAKISYPIFSAMQDIWSLNQASLKEKESFYQLQNLKQNLEYDLMNSFFALQNAQEEVGVQKLFVIAARERSEVSRVQYTNGLISFQDWDTIENDLIQNEKQMLNTIKNLELLDAEWNLKLGKGLTNEKK